MLELVLAGVLRATIVGTTGAFAVGTGDVLATGAAGVGLRAAEVEDGATLEGAAEGSAAGLEVVAGGATLGAVFAAAVAQADVDAAEKRKKLVRNSHIYSGGVWRVPSVVAAGVEATEEVVTACAALEDVFTVDLVALEDLEGVTEARIDAVEELLDTAAFFPIATPPTVAVPDAVMVAALELEEEVSE